MMQIDDDLYKELMNIKIQLEKEYRNTIQELKYYNSDLSKFIGKECKKIMTSIDLDLWQYKKSTTVIRKGEFKHIDEDTGFQQLSLLKKQADVDRYLNKKFGWNRFETCIIWGNYPFESIIVWDVVNDIKFELIGDEVKTFLTLEHIKKGEVYEPKKIIT